MGGAVSAGEDNDELRSKKFSVLCLSRYSLERWTSPPFCSMHLLRGTGYLSTMVGLVLGKTGINHGVELHQSVVDYAYKKLEEFKTKLSNLTQFEFCEPTFISGNFLKIDPSTIRQYDRVYCGTACTEKDEPYLRQFIKINGLLVMPIDDQLAVINRVSDTEFKKRYVYAVSFAAITRPKPDDVLIKLPMIDPVKLTELCRNKVKGLINLSSCRENEEWQKSPERRILTYYNLIDET
uniref:Uncharacterized protein n=1 Tax=Tetranychus urticae TaxID=32264 RepID=T1K2J9_TETUR